MSKKSQRCFATNTMTEITEYAEKFLFFMLISQDSNDGPPEPKAGSTCNLQQFPLQVNGFLCLTSTGTCFYSDAHTMRPVVA